MQGRNEAEGGERIIRKGRELEKRTDKVTQEKERRRKRGWGTRTKGSLGSPGS